MADEKISALPEITTIASDDLLTCVDGSDGGNKKFKLSSLFNASAAPVLNAVADLDTLNAISTENLVAGAICVVFSMQGRPYLWSGASWIAQRINHTASSDPNQADDVNAGYLPGDILTNTANQRSFYCVANDPAAAVWRPSPFGSLSIIPSVIDADGNDILDYSLGFGIEQKMLFFRGNVSEGELYQLTTFNNYDAETPPSIDDDSTKSYGKLSGWIDYNTRKIYQCVDQGGGEAVWADLTDNYYEAKITGTQSAIKDNFENFNVAYSDGKTFNLIAENTTESSSTTIISGSQASAVIYQNTFWDLGNNKIIADVGASSMSITLQDPSSTFRYLSEPFGTFDENSSLVIYCNGGAIENYSTTGNTSIAAGGSLIIRDCGSFVLPSQDICGIQTNEYSLIDNIVFEGGGADCENALVLNGGSVSNIIFNGNFKTGGVIFSATAKTSLSNFQISIDANGTGELLGEVNSLRCQNSPGIIFTANVKSGTSIVNSSIDNLLLDSGVTDVSVSNSTIASLSLSDNTITASFSNVNFTSTFNLYGAKIKFVNCTFADGFTPQTGSTSYFSCCDSVTSITWGSATKYRSANDANIGNDY